MATICPYYAKCTSCNHFRPDPDRDGQKTCWLAYDQKAAAAGAPAVPEQITAAAMVFHLSDGTNHTCTGNHHAVILANFRIYRKNHKLAAIKSTESGFLTDTGRFLDRTEAMTLARTNGQLKTQTDRTELNSDDLW